MKGSGLLMVAISAMVMAVGCTGAKRFHDTPMPDPKTFNAHFGDMDTTGDGLVNWDEFAAHFSHAEPKVFKAIDSNQDGEIDHEEWHAFKSVHGIKSHY